MTNPYKIVAYCDQPSVRHGDTLRCMVSTTAKTFSANLARLNRNPGAHKKLDSTFSGEYPGKQQGFTPGSYVRFERTIELPLNPTFEVIVRPTRPIRGNDQAIMTWGASHGLFINAEGYAEFRWRGAIVRSSTPLASLRWYSLSASVEAATNTISLSLHSFEFNQGDQWSLTTTSTHSASVGDGVFCIAACRESDGISDVFDGKIEAPKLSTVWGGVIAQWDFSLAQESDTVFDIGKNRFHGTLVNSPQRAMTGHNWSGKAIKFLDAPDEYGAIAFHCDDLTDARWEPAISWKIPDDLTPGIYGIELKTDEGYDCVPFVVRSRQARAEAKVAFLLPTFSHLAYANERHWWANPGIEAISGKTLEELIGDADRWTDEQGLLSVYDTHQDRTGNCHSSWALPQANMRPGYVHPLLQGPHQLGADLYVTDWLDSLDIPYDVITDHDLHFEGTSALENYNVVLTGQHPEYVSSNMLDALTSYTRDGGNIMYLGGNGFFFVASVSLSNSNVLEVRRGIAGVVPWYSQVGEVGHASTGEFGGTWASRGREPHVLMGVGTAGVVFGKAAPFYRNEVSKLPEYSWIFSGVEGDEIFAKGDLMGGPAGFEFDRMDYRRGSPTTTVSLATAREFEGVTLPLPEDLPSTGEVLGEARCDMAYYNVPGGGSVFSSSSMSWVPCLMVDEGDNDIARITQNVLLRFLED